MAENIQSINSAGESYLYTTFSALSVTSDYTNRLIFYASNLFNDPTISFIASAIWANDTRYYGVVSCWNTASGEQGLVGSSLMQSVYTYYYTDRIEVYAQRSGFNIGGFVVGKVSS